MKNCIYIFFTTLFLIHSTSILGQTRNYITGGLNVDVTESNPCDGATNGSITFKINSVTSGTATVQTILGSTGVSLFTSVPVNQGNSFTFNDNGAGLPAGSYQFIIVDLANTTDFVNTFGNPTVLENLAPITINQDIVKINSSCPTPNGEIQISLTANSGSLGINGGAGTSSFTYTWSSDNGLTGLPLTDNNWDGTGVLNLGTLIGSGLPGGTYTLKVEDNYSVCEASVSITITDPSPVKILPVSDHTICNPYNSDLNIVISNAQNGVEYELQTITGTSFTPQIKGTGNGSNLTLTIPQAQAPTTTTTYRVRAVDGLCTPAILDDKAVVTVNNRPVATFNYPTPPYCSNGTDPSPNFTGGGVAGAFTATPVGLSINPTTGVIDLSASTAGTYTVTNTIAAANGCPVVTATSQITITALPIATFSYADDPYCKTGTDPSPTFTGGGVGGTFTSSTGLVINATTGEVDLSASTAGTYTVTNTVAAANGCPEVTATATITINDSPVATFNYPASSYCSNGTDPSPNFTGGGVAGTFSSSVGLVIDPGTGTVDLSASTPGTYTVTNTIAASGGCPIVTATSSITITALPIATFSYADDPYCKTGTDPSPTFTGGGVGGTFTSSTGLVINATTGEVDLSASTAGTYTVTNTVAAANGCPEVTATATITINDLPVATFIYPDNPYCSNGTDPSPTFTGGGVAGTFSSSVGLVIDPGTGTVDLSASTAGTYTVTNTIAASGGCPIVTATSSITITALPIATFSYADDPYCKTGTDPSPTFTGGGVGGTFTSSTGLVISATTGVVDLSASTAGTYTVTNTVAAANGCPEVTATATITINDLPVATFIYPDNPYCSNGTDPSPTFTGGGVAGTFSSSVGLVIDPGTGTVDLSASTAGTYTVTNTIAASGGCPIVTATSSITITALPIATFSYADDPYCKTGTDPSPTFTGGGVGGTFTSSTGLVISATTGVVDLSASTAGTYTVTNTVAAANGCPEITATATITINDLPVATFSYPASPYCSNGTDPSPVYTGGGVAGTFSSSVGLVIDPGTGTVDLSASTAGTYTVTNTIGASGGCPIVTATSQITITALPIATFSYADDPYCKTGTDPSPTFTGGGVGGTFTSSTGLVINATTGEVDLSASTAGTYTVTNTVAAANGCPEVTATATITINDLPVATFIYPDNPYCSNGTDPSPTFTGGGVAGTFSSSVGLVIDPGTGTVDLSASTAGTYTVTNTIAASGGCPIVTATSSITITALPIATFSYADDPYCKTGTDPSPTFTGGGVGGTFTSSTGLVISATTGVVDLSASTAGTYTVTNTVAAANGCPEVTATATITINDLPVATFIYPDNPYCSNGTDPSPTFTGGGVAGTFSSSVGLVIDPGTGTVDLSASTAGTYTVTNTIAASGGCPIVTATSSITITALPIATFSYADDPYCKTGTDPSPTFTGGGVGGTFTSSTGLVISATTGVVDLSASTAGTYTVTNTVAAANGCPEVTATATITINDLPVATFNYPDNPYCSNGTDPNPNFTGGGVAGTFTATPTGLSINAATGVVDLSASRAGTYTVTNTIRASGGCPVVTADAQIIIIPIPTATLSGDTTICSGESTDLSIVLTGTSPWEIVYSDGTTNTTLTGITTSPHTFTVGPLINSTTYSLVSVSDATICGAGTVNGTAQVNISPVLGDPTIYGDETWIGYVYDDSNDTRPYPTKIDFDINKYKGFIDQADIPTNGRRSYYHIPSDTFHLHPERNPLIGRNLCKPMTDDFSIRFRMRKTFAEGTYTFTVGADDGVKFYIDGTELLNDPNSFTTHRYTKYSTAPICLNGQHELVIEYFDAKLHSSLSFDYKVSSVSISKMPLVLCAGGTVLFTAVPSNAGDNPTYQWQLDGLNVVGQTGRMFATNSLLNGQRVRVLMKADGATCSVSSNEITVNIGDTPTPTGASTQSFCNSANPTVANLVAIGTDIKWYENPVGGVALARTTPLVDNKKYYATQTLAACGESATRLEVTVSIFNDTPAPTGDANQTFCIASNPTIADLVANGTAIKWYANITGGAELASTTALSNNTTYYASQTVTGCGESSARFAVTVTLSRGTPRPTGPNNQSFCANSSPTVADLVAVGTDIKWYIQRNGGTPLPTNTILTNNRLYFASQTLPACGEGRRRLPVLVTIFNDTPAPTGDANQIFCANTTLTLANIQVVGSNIKWYATPTSNVPLSITTPLVDRSSYYATQTVPGCGESRTRLEVSVTVSPIPTAPTGDATQSFCTNSNPTVANLTATGTDIKWYLSATGGTALTSTTALVNGITYYASQTVVGCGESTTRLAVAVTIFNATPAPTGTANQSFCTNSNPTVANLAATGTDIKWYANATGGTALATTDALVHNTTYYASQTVTGCGESATRLAVTVTLFNATPTPTGDVNQTFCTNSNPRVGDLVANGTGIKWYLSATGSNFLASTTALVNGITYYASQTVAGCGESTTRLAVAVTILNATPAPTGTANQSFCTNSNPTVANLAATGTDIKWYANATGGTALATTDALVHNTTYYASQTVTGCGESATRLAVTVTIFNTTPIPTGDATQTFCTNSNPTVANLTATGTDIKWYLNATGGTALASTTALVNGITYYASQTVTGCGESATRLAVTVTIFNTTPIPTGDATQTFCTNSNPTVANLTATGTDIKWYLNATGGTALASTTALVNGITYYASQTVTGCGESATRLAVIVTIFNTTPIPTGDATQTFCTNSNPTVANLTATGTDIKWYLTATGGTALATTTALVNGITYYASQTVAGCGESATRLAVTVTIFNTTPIPTGDATQTFCTNSNPTVANLTATGTDIKWYLTATGGTALATRTALVNGITYYASQTVTGCGESATRLAVTVTIFNTTPIPTGDATQTFCTNSNPTVANLTATGTDIKWYLTATGGTALATTTALVNNTDYYATQTVAGCGESATRLKVNVRLNAGTPTVPTGITTNNITCVSFRITWQAVADATSYRLDIATDANFNAILPGYNDLLVNGTNTTVTGLAQGTQYFYRLRAVNQCGASTNSATGNVTTSNTGCGGGGGNCGAFTSIIEKQGATKLPTCASPESGSITYQIAGGSGLYEVQLRDVTDATYTRFGQNRGGEVTVNALKAATYFVIVKDVNTGAICDGSVTNPPRRVTIGTATTVKADTVQGSRNHVVCHGNKTGSVNLKDLSGSTTGNYFYSINGGAWVQLQIDRVPNFGDPNGLIPGTNAIRIGEKADDPCPQVLTVILNPSNPAIVANGINITAASCGGTDGKVKIEATNITGGSGTFTGFEFNGKNYTALPIEENALAAGNYPLIVTDDSGCSTSIDIKVPGGTDINPSIFPMDADCDSPTGASGGIFVSFTGSTTDLLKIINGVKYTVILKESGKEIDKYEFDLKKGTHLPASHTFSKLGAGIYTVEITTADATCGKTETHTISGTTAINFNHQVLCTNSSAKSLRLYNIKGESGKPYRLKYIDRKTNKVFVMAKPINLVRGTDEITISGEPFLKTTKEYILRLEQEQTGCVAPQVISADSKDGLLILAKSITAAIKGTTKSLPDRPTGTFTIHKIIGGFKPKKTPQPYSIRATLRVPTKPGQEYSTDFEKVELNPNTLGFEKVFTNAPAGIYLIEIVDLLGCGVSFEVEVPLDTDIFIPNVFTPNGDNDNETFFVRNLPEEGNTKLIVSNRWGKEVYSSDNYDNSWDGGEEKEGVYFYSLAIPNDKVYTGWVEIIRGSR